MSAQEYRHHRTAPVWGIFLLTIGIILLLQTLNILSWSFWGTLWRYWPALLIAIGVAIILRRFNIWLTSIIILIIIGGAAGIAAWQYNHGQPQNVTGSFNQPLGNINSGVISIDFSAGSLSIESLNEPGYYVSAAASEFDHRQTLQANYQQQGNTGILNLKTVNQQFWNGATTTWDLKVAPDIPLTLDITCSAANINLDLSQLKVTDLSLNISAANCELILPSAAGFTMASIETSVSNTVVTIPEGVGARIRSNISAGSVEIDTGRFPASGGLNQSPNYDNSPDRIDINLESSVSRIQVK